MLSDNDLMRVQEVSSKLTKPVKLLVFGTGSQDYFERQLFGVARQVSGVSMNSIGLEETSEPVIPGKPSITITSGDDRRINYLASPEGAELAPFLDVISWLGSDSFEVSPSIKDNLDQLDLPVNIMVLMASSCPHCPHTVRSALMQAAHSQRVSVSVVDALEFSDLAKQFKCKSTPTTIINGEMTIVGNIGAEELSRKLVESTSEGSLTSVVDSMVKSGRAEDAARLVCGKRQPRALVEVFEQKEFSTRIGALVAMELALETDPKIFDSVLKDLCEFLFVDDVALKGDTAELLGKIGNKEAIDSLKLALGDDDEDVREAVQEALEALEAESTDE